MSEKLDFFDSSFNHMGVADREAIHKEGLWHQTFHCWIIRKRENKYYILFQKRSPNKKDFPNMLDITAAGHITAGETKEDGIREVNEELGIDANYDSLVYLGVRTEVLEKEAFKNCEFQFVYLLEDNTPLESYKVQEDEVSALIEVELSDGLKLLFEEVDSIDCDAVFYEGKKNLCQKYKVKREDMITRIDGYYKKVFIMAQRYFSGEKYLTI